MLSARRQCTSYFPKCMENFITTNVYVGRKKKFEMHTWEESSNSSWKIGVMEFRTFFYRAHLVVTVSMSFLQYPQSKHLISISYIFLLFKHNTKANKIKTWV